MYLHIASISPQELPRLCYSDVCRIKGSGGPLTASEPSSPAAESASHMLLWSRLQKAAKLPLDPWCATASFSLHPPSAHQQFLSIFL